LNVLQLIGLYENNFDKFVLDYNDLDEG